MTIDFDLRDLGALITLGLGLMGLLVPKAAAAFTSLRPEGRIGTSEIRATYGGFFVALGGWALWTGSTPVFTVVGLAWLGAAAGRLVSVALDRSVSPKNLGGVVFEAAVGLLLLAP